MDVLEVVPRDDRDLALVRLVTPVTTLQPAVRAPGLPAAQSDLSAAGFGRTTTEWVPDKLHAGAFTLTASTPTGLEITGKGTTALCKGDTGGPLLNTDGQIIGVNSRSWQGGCLGAPSAETRTGALSARVDDLSTWIQQAQAAAWQGPLTNANSDKCLEIENSQTADGAPAQQWTCHDMPTMRWDLVKGKWGYWLKNRNSGKCLEIEDSLVTDGARAQQWTCHDIPTQQWTFPS